MNVKRRTLTFGRCILVSAVGFLFACGSTMAQTATGRIIGTVIDAQSAAIAGAKITITNTGTNVHWNTVSNPDGFYQVLMHVEAVGVADRVPMHVRAGIGDCDFG